jgi:dTDP-4-amino-4,6-dideoxygalactose transaminase
VSWRIPFNRASLAGPELDYVREAVESGHLSADGPFTRRCESALERRLGALRALLTASGTQALELAALLLEVGPDDEVIVPSFAYPTSAAAFALRGARIVFADIRPDTLNVDESRVPDLVTPRTRVILALHYAGVGAELDELLGLGVPVVEDNALGLFGAYRGRPLGTIGRLGAQSFHETKNVTSGEGGALLVNDPSDVERAEVVHDKGTNRREFMRGRVDRYTWVDLGSSFGLSELSAAFLAAQLERADEIQVSRRRIWERYARGLAAWADRAGASLPVVPAHCEPAWHLFYVLMPSAEARDALIARLGERGILAVFHYQPLHLSRMGAAHGGRPGLCPVTEDLSERLVRLPFYTSLSEADQAEVIEVVTRA